MELVISYMLNSLQTHFVGSVANGQASGICLQLGHRVTAVPVIGPHKGPELAEKTGRITPHTTTNLEHVSHGLAGTSFDLGVSGPSCQILGICSSFWR